MNSSNTDPLPEQGAIVAPFISPLTLYEIHAPELPSFPLQLSSSDSASSRPDSGAPGEGGQGTDPDWSTSPLPKLPSFLQRLPESITLLKVASDFGLDQASFNGTRYRCPFHDDKHPSLKLNQSDSKLGWFYCFGCGLTGDLVHWVAARTKESKLNAYMTIRSHYGLGPDDILRVSSAQLARGKVRLGGIRTPTLPELETLASAGSWNLTALRLLATRDLLRIVPRYRDRLPAYALIDPCYRVAVLRRLDGRLWNGTEKALLAKGSNLGVPIGVHQIEGFDCLALCEGGPDYFRLASLITEAGSSDSILPLMMPSAIATKINPGLIAAFRHKRVRIFAHNDPHGIASAKSWQAQLQKAGAEVDLWIPPAVALPDGHLCSDLQDLYFKLSPHTRATLLPQLELLLNFHVTLFPSLP